MSEYNNPQEPEVIIDGDAHSQRTDEAEYSQLIEQLEHIIEAAIFASDEPLTIKQMQALFEEEEIPTPDMLRQAVTQLKEVYASRSIELKELASGFTFQVKKGVVHRIHKLWQERAPRYSRALLETLAIIAYRQPITRAEIEDIRGVAVSSSIIKNLSDHGWIRSVGYREVPGKPELLATTKQFLDHFNMKSLDQLPPLAEIKELLNKEDGPERQIELQLQATHQTIEAPEEINPNVEIELEIAEEVGEAAEESEPRCDEQNSDDPNNNIEAKPAIKSEEREEKNDH